MSNSDTGLNKILSDIGRLPGQFYRDTPMLFRVLDSLESTRKSVDALVAYENGDDISDGLKDDEK